MIVVVAASNEAAQEIALGLPFSMREFSEYVPTLSKYQLLHLFEKERSGEISSRSKRKKR